MWWQPLCTLTLPLANSLSPCSSCALSLDFRITSTKKKKKKNNRDTTWIPLQSTFWYRSTIQINNSIRIKVESDKYQQEVEVTFCRISKEKESQWIYRRLPGGGGTWTGPWRMGRSWPWEDGGKGKVWTQRHKGICWCSLHHTGTPPNPMSSKHSLVYAPPSTPSPPHCPRPSRLSAQIRKTGHLLPSQDLCEVHVTKFIDGQRVTLSPVYPAITEEPLLILGSWKWAIWFQNHIRSVETLPRDGIKF